MLEWNSIEGKKQRTYNWPEPIIQSTPESSINQSNFYSANIPGVARLGGASARSVFKYKVVKAIP